MGIVAHPGDITSVDVSHDGRYFFTAGGFDLSVNMWRIEVEEHRQERAAHQRALRGPSDGADESAPRPASHAEAEATALKPFFALLEGGEGGELHRDIVDYLYYCQLRHVGEDSMEPRNLTGNCTASAFFSILPDSLSVRSQA
jgi:hypothetical protein